MRRIAAFLAVLSLAIPLTASAQMHTERLYMRSTTAASSVVANLNWAAGTPGNPTNAAFSDSVTFAHATGSAATNIDTTAAYHVSRWPFSDTQRFRGGGFMMRAQKTSGNAGPATEGGVTDSVVVDTADATPWIVIRVHQDSTAYGNFSGGTSLDSVYIHAQWSQDGVVWYGLNGTPTRAGGFLNSTSPFGTATEGGIVHQSLTATEANQAFDEVDFPLQCQPSIITQSSNLIINRTACMLPERYWIRFLVTVENDGYGQYGIDVDYWGDDMNIGKAGR